MPLAASSAAIAPQVHPRAIRSTSGQTHTGTASAGTAYKEADLIGRKAIADQLVKYGAVRLITRPTEVRYEQTVKGLAYVRPLDEPFKGKLCVVDAEFVK